MTRSHDNRSNPMEYALHRSARRTKSERANKMWDVDFEREVLDALSRHPGGVAADEHEEES